MTYNTGNALGSTDPRDLYDNAEALDRAVNDSAATFVDRFGNTRATLSGAVDPNGIAQGAIAAAAQAEAAADAAELSAGIYADTAAGLAATTSGQHFSVPSAESSKFLTLYLNSSGTAVEIKAYPSAQAVQDVSAVAAGLPMLFDVPNQWRTYYYEKLLAAAGTSADPDGIFSASPGSVMSLSSKDGVTAAIMSSSNGASEQTRIWRAAIASLGLVAGQSFCMSCRLWDRVGTAALSRIILRQFDAAGAEITAARVSYVIPAASVFKSGAQVSLTATVHASAARVGFQFGVGALADSYAVSHILFAVGANSAYRPPTQAISALYVSPTGSDTATGQKDAPLATLNAAVNRLGGVGTIYMEAGIYDGATIDKSLVKDVEIIGQATAAFERPIVRLGTKLTGITKTSGRTKVYQSSIAMTGQPNWIWLDGVPDATTLIPADEAHPLQDGRAHRLWCTRIRKTTATALAAALTEIDAASIPLCFYDSGVLYFSVPGGADATTGHDIYVTTSGQRFTTGGPLFWSSVNKISITGVEVRYGQLDLRGFRSTRLRSVKSIGSPNNGIDYAWYADVAQCEACGAGSAFEAGTTGDGGNVHNFGETIEYRNYWHDNNDDGWSPHEFCRGSADSCVAEYNIGSGLIPAYGANYALSNCTTRKNAVDARVSSIKLGGIEAHMSPIAEDPGVRTSVNAINCVSIGDKNGFVDRNTTDGDKEAYLTAVNCVAISPADTGFACNVAINCSHSGTGTARNASTSVVAGAPLTA